MDRLPDRNVNYERFPPEYFSGSNIRIYFGDIFVDEITLLSFSLQEQVMPVHGYNSFTFDHVFRGNRMVQGGFSINFKDVNYLSSMTDAILEGNYDEYKANSIKEPTPENINKLYGYVNEGWTNDFKKYSEDFKQAIWGDGGRSIYQRSRPTYFNHKDKSFDILISYGDDGQEEGRHPVEKRYRENVNRGTIKSIKDVHINQVNQTIDISGEPIAEEYSFFAKDLDRSKNDRAPISQGVGGSEVLRFQH